MDLLICSALTVLELTSLRSALEADVPSIFSKFIVVLLLQYVTLKLYRIVLYPAFFSPLRHLPGPKDNNLFLGQEVNRYRAESPIGLELEWMREWPNAPFIRSLTIAGRETLLVNSLGAHKAFLQTHVYDFVKPPFFARMVGEITGKGLLFAEGDQHRHQRKLLSGPFSVPSIRKIMPVFQEEAQRLSGVFESAIGEKPYSSIEVTNAFSESFMDTIGIAVLGIRLETLSSIYPLGFQELYNRMLHQEPVGQLISLVNAFVPIRRFLPLEANHRFIRAKNDLGKMLREIIEKRARELADGTFRREMGESRDILTYMLEEAEVQRKETGAEVWTVDDIVGHLLNFTSAGHESTSTTLVWAVYVLSTKHAIQDKLRAEIQLLLENNPKPSHDEISGLPYLNNFLREVLRLYSPTIMVPRTASRDLLIEGVLIPQGTQVELRGPTIHHHPGVWGFDSAGTFDPDRFNTDTNTNTNTNTNNSINPYAFEAFLQGPRMCPGRHLALAGVKAMLVELVRRWRFLGVEGVEGVEGGQLLAGGEEEVGRGVRVANPSLTFRPAGGLRVRFERA
ncbi:cytochrome P450 [Biscogniauxia marginata]|nr:cytochrome P450 [Biscogniauxia marginata]